jgi:ribosomal protein S2
MESHQLLLFIGQHEFIHVIIEFLISNTDYFASTEKWIGGTLTNWKMIRSYIYKLFSMTSNDIGVANFLRTDQKIQQKINRYAQMRLLLYGFRFLPALPNIIILFNHQDSDQSSFFEALILNIPIISIVNTKSNAFGITYPIFSNDNTFESLFFISNLMYNCILNSFYERRLLFFKNISFLYSNMLKKTNIKNLKISPLLLYKTELFLAKYKTFKSLKIKKILKKTFFLIKYNNQKNMYKTNAKI